MNGPDGASAARAASCDRPAPPGSLVERELSAVRLTEGLMRFVLCRGRYLQPLRHGAKHRATSPYAGETLPFGNVFTMPEQLDHALPSPQGEGLKVRVLRHHRAAHPRPLPHFQSSMLLHNLSRNFSLSKKASQRALRCTHLPHRTAAITHPAANAHQAAPVSADHRPEPQCTRPQRRIRPQRPTRRKTGFPQSLHRVFHIFAGFPQRLSFPLAFFERDRVRYAYAVRSYCAVRPGLVWYGWVRYGAPLLCCYVTRDKIYPQFRAQPAENQ